MTENNNPGEHRDPGDFAESADPVSPDTQDQEPIPLMQRVLDNPFLLLVLGIAIPTVFYIIWGVMEITQIPIAD